MRRILLAASVLAGCSDRASDGQLRDLRRRLDTSEQARAEMARKLDELDNRVFLLTDQVESQKVALGRRGGDHGVVEIAIQPAPPGPRDTIIGTDAVDAAPQAPLPDPPTTISGNSRRTIRLEGGATPWLDHGDDRSPAPGHDRIASAASPPVAGRRARPASPPVDQGLGVTHGRPPLVDEVVAGGAVPASVEAAAASGEEDPTSLYRAAYARLKAGAPAIAADEFRSFVRRFPHHDLADNAQYWLAETFYARGAYKEAEPEFRAVLRRWPGGNKVPDALLKLGFCLLAAGEAAPGRTALQQVIDQYPRTEAAALAHKRLGELPAENSR